MPRRSKKSDNSHDHINRRAESFSFVGRQDEIKIITDKFVKEDNVSIAFIFGPAKTGKDRVALEIGHELVKIYDADRAEDPESDILHAYAIDVSKYEASGTKLEDIIKEELKEHHGMSGDLNSFLKRSKEYHLVILNNCQHYSKDSGKQSEFLDALGDLTKTHDKILFIVTSRSIFKMSGEHVHKHILWPLSPPDVASLLRSIAGKVDNLEEHLDEIVKFAYPLPECIIQIANSLKDKEYTPKEMVEVLERSTLSICSDEAYSNKERLNVQIKKDFVNLTDIMSEFLSTLSFMGGDTISPEVIAERMKMTEAEVKQDFLLRCERHGLMTRSQDTYARAEGSKDLSISLIGDEKHMEPELKNDELSCQLLTRFRAVGLSVTEEPELELDKHQKKVQDLRDKLLNAVRPSRQGHKLKHLEEAINIATEILKTFVTERECIKFKEEASALVEQSLKDSQSDAKSLSPETKQDKMPVQVDDCSSTPGRNDSCGEYHGETNGRLISGPISSSGEQQDTWVLQPQDDVQSHPEVAKGLQPTESAGKSEFSTDTTGDQSTRLKITNRDYKCQVKPSLTHRDPRNVKSTNYPGNRLFDYDQTEDFPFNGIHGMLLSVTSNDSTIPPNLNESGVPCGAAQSYNSVHTPISSKTYLENGRVDSVERGNKNIGEQYNTYETLTQIKEINDKPREVDEIEGNLPNSVTEQPTRNHQQTPRAPSNLKVMTHNGYPVIVDSKCVQTSLNFNPTNHKCDIIPKHVQHVPGTQADRQVYQDSPAFAGLRERHYHRNQRENEDLYRQYGDQIDQARRLQGEHQNDNQTSCVDQSSQREHLQRTPMDHFYEGTPADRQGYYQGSPAFTGSTDSHYHRKQRQNGDLYRQYGGQTDQARRLQGEHQYDNQTSRIDQPSGHEHLQRPNGAAPAGFLNGTQPHQAHEPDKMVRNAGNTQRKTSDSDDDSGVFAKTPR